MPQDRAQGRAHPWPGGSLVRSAARRRRGQAQCDEATHPLVLDLVEGASSHFVRRANLERWVERNRTHGPALAAELDLRRIRHDLDASARIARWAYGYTAGLGSLVWVRGKEVEPLGPGWEPLLEE